MKKLLYIMENLVKTDTNNGNAYQFSNHLNKNNYDVTFLTTSNQENKELNLIGNVPIKILPSHTLLGRELNFPKNYFRDYSDTVDIVWCYLSRPSSFHCAKFASKYKKKLIIKCDSVINYEGLNPIKRLWKYFTVTYPLKKADLIIAESQRVFNAVSPINPNTIIIPNGVSVSTMPNLDTILKEKIILSIGRIEPVKGIENLIAAFKKLHSELSDWKLKIIGPLVNETYVNGLKQLVKDWNLNDWIEFTGPKYKEDLYMEMAKGSIYVIASKPFGDGLNNTLPYAMYFGCTPVITDVGDIASMIYANERKFGYSCKESELLQLYSSIKEAIANPIDPKDLKRHITLNYNWDTNLNILLNSINKLT